MCHLLCATNGGQVTGMVSPEPTRGESGQQLHTYDCWDRSKMLLESQQEHRSPQSATDIDEPAHFVISSSSRDMHLHDFDFNIKCEVTERHVGAHAGSWGGALTKMPSQEAEAKSAEWSCARPKPWSGTTMGGSASWRASVITLPCTEPVPYLIANWPPVSCCPATCQTQ